MASADLQAALARARKHARSIGRNLADALEAHESGEHDSAARCLRAAQQAHTWLGAAHADIEGQIEDSDANPTAAEGAQTSDGEQPRAASDAVVNRLLGSFRAGARELKR